MFTYKWFYKYFLRATASTCGRCSRNRARATGKDECVIGTETAESTSFSFHRFLRLGNRFFGGR
jgi:hypothetical protein